MRSNSGERRCIPSVREKSAFSITGTPASGYPVAPTVDIRQGTERKREDGGSAWLVGLNPGVLAVIQRSSLGELLGRKRMYFTMELAVATYLASPAGEGAA